MAWIDDTDLDLLEKVFESKNLIPTNKKGGLKLRHISFFNTNMKAITNVCKTLVRASRGVEQAHQYTEVLRKMGLINRKCELTKYGEMLLQVIHYDDSRIIRELSKQEVNIDSVPEDIPYIIEFFLFCVVKKCMDNPEECEKNGVNTSDIDSESINNLTYFFDNIIDTINEPTNKTSNLNELFSFDNDDFYYTMQGMNFTGYEIKKLIRLPREQIERVWKTYLRLLNEVRNVDKNNLSDNEKKYYEYALYYTKQVQKDVRNRVRHSVFNYILFNSITHQRDRLKLVKQIKYESIIPYKKIEEIYKKYNLADIYNLVFFYRNSKYIVKQIKKLGLVNDNLKTLDEDMKIIVDEACLSKYKINIGDSFVVVNLDEDKILRSNVYVVTKIISDSDGILLQVMIQEAVNMECADEILIKMKG